MTAAQSRGAAVRSAPLSTMTSTPSATTSCNFGLGLWDLGPEPQTVNLSSGFRAWGLEVLEVLRHLRWEDVGVKDLGLRTLGRGTLWLEGPQG